MANIDNPHGFVATRNLYDGAIPMWKGEIKASQTIAIGDVLTSSSGYLRIIGTVTEVPIGIATEAAASPTVGTTFKYIPTLPGIVFTAQCEATMTQALIGTLVDLQTAATGAGEVNENASTNDTMRIIGISKLRNTSIGTNTDVEVVFNKTMWATGLSA